MLLPALSRNALKNNIGMPTAEKSKLISVE